MTVVVSRSIDIDAPLSAAWAVMSDVERWSEWTASVTSATRTRTGPLVVGERVVVVQPRLPTVTYTVTEVDEGRSFTWEAGGAVSRGIGEHVLTPRVGGGATATLRVRQEGLAAPLATLLLRRIADRYVRMEAEGLKARSEAGAPDSGDREPAPPH